jgi:glycosyltransferase involved in cell wall biosynthesis
VIPQSAEPPAQAPRRSTRRFDVAVIGHLRPVKDPFRTAMAARLLPAESRVRVIHAGAALSEAMRVTAETEQRTNPRYRWVGELPRWKARALIARCHLLALTSEMEGGANVLSEAIAAGTPIVASRIACTAAILGEDYPGLFPLGSTRALARLLRRAEEEPGFLRELARRCRTRRRMLSPQREIAAWRNVMRELGRS